MKQTIIALVLCVTGLHLAAADRPALSEAAAAQSTSTVDQLEGRVARLQHDLEQAERIHRDLEKLCKSNMFRRPAFFGNADYCPRRQLALKIAELLRGRLSPAELAPAGQACSSPTGTAQEQSLSYIKLWLEERAEWAFRMDNSMIDIASRGHNPSCAVAFAARGMDYDEEIDRSTEDSVALFGYLMGNQTCEFNLCLRSLKNFKKPSLIDVAVCPYLDVAIQTDPADIAAVAFAAGDQERVCAATPASSASSTECALLPLEQQVQQLSQRLDQIHQENDDLMAVLIARKYYFHEYQFTRYHNMKVFPKLLELKVAREILQRKVQDLSYQRYVLDGERSECSTRRFTAVMSSVEKHDNDARAKLLGQQTEELSAQLKPIKKELEAAEAAVALECRCFKSDLTWRALQTFSAIAAISQKADFESPAAPRSASDYVAARALKYVAGVCALHPHSNVEHEAAEIQRVLENVPVMIDCATEIEHELLGPVPEDRFDRMTSQQRNAYFAELDDAAKRGPGPLAGAVTAVRPTSTTQPVRARRSAE